MRYVLIILEDETWVAFGAYRSLERARRDALGYPVHEAKILTLRDPPGTKRAR